MAAALCLYGTLAIDFRGALLIALAISALILLLPRLRVASGLGLIVLLSPAVIIGLLGFLANSDAVNTFSRSGSDLASGTNRLYVWGPVWEYLAKPSIQLVYGFGANGHITSGVSSHYAYLYTGAPNPTSYTTHNVVLQTALDSGYVGVALLLLAEIRTISLLQRASEPMTDALLASTAVLFLCGATEALPIDFVDALVAFLLLVGVATSLRGESPAVPDPWKAEFQSPARGARRRASFADSLPEARGPVRANT